MLDICLKDMNAVEFKLEHMSEVIALLKHFLGGSVFAFYIQVQIIFFK